MFVLSELKTVCQSISISVIFLKTVIRNLVTVPKLVLSKQPDFTQGDFDILLRPFCRFKHFPDQRVMVMVGALNPVSFRTVNESDVFSPVNDTSCDDSILINIANGNFPANIIIQELCESRGGRPGLSVLTSLLASVDVKIY